MPQSHHSAADFSTILRELRNQINDLICDDMAGTTASSVIENGLVRCQELLTEARRRFDGEKGASRPPRT